MIENKKPSLITYLKNAKKNNNKVTLFDLDLTAFDLTETESKTQYDCFMLVINYSPKMFTDEQMDYLIFNSNLKHKSLWSENALLMAFYYFSEISLTEKQIDFILEHSDLNAQNTEELTPISQIIRYNGTHKISITQKQLHYIICNTDHTEHPEILFHYFHCKDTTNLQWECNNIKTLVNTIIDKIELYDNSFLLNMGDYITDFWPYLDNKEKFINFCTTHTNHTVLSYLDIDVVKATKEKIILKDLTINSQSQVTVHKI